MAGNNQKKRSMPERNRTAACKKLKASSSSLSKKSSANEKKKIRVVDNENCAVQLTSDHHNEDRPNRRLTEFTLHDQSGQAQPLEMLEVNNMFISAFMLPLEGSTEKNIRCEGFGRIESWSISGYEDGIPVVWLSTGIADYECLEPATNYKMLYGHFFEKARACMVVYQQLAKSSGGNPEISLDELLAGVVRPMSGCEIFSGTASVIDFVIYHGNFIYNQLTGLEMTSEKDDTKFADISVLAALKNESKKQRKDSNAPLMNKSLRNENNMTSQEEEDIDAKYARLTQEAYYWKSMIKKKSRISAKAPRKKYYIQIHEEEIANDYPLPVCYKPSVEKEIDEYIVFGKDYDASNTDGLPRKMLHDWSLYDSDARLISLELLPMQLCSGIDVAIFGSGRMTSDDGSWVHLDADAGQSSSSADSEAQAVHGVPVSLSATREWIIGFSSSSMISISIRTDMAWYRLGKPSKNYAGFYEPILKTARIAISIINLLKEESRVARLRFENVISRLAQFSPNDRAYISSDTSVVQRYVIVHGQIILQLFAEFPDKNIRKCSFVTGLIHRMEERHHTKCVMKKNKSVRKSVPNLNPREATKRSVMQATRTATINRIWGEYYSNHMSEERACNELKEEDDEAEEKKEHEDGDDAEEEALHFERTKKSHSVSKQTKPYASAERQIEWDGEPEGKTNSGCVLYRRATINNGDVVSVGGSVLLESDECPDIYYVEYMYESVEGSKMFHGRLMKHALHTVLGNAGNERELFLTNECKDMRLKDVKQKAVVDIRKVHWGHQHRKDSIAADKLERAKAEERKRKGLPIEYYCKSLYWPERGAFFSLPYDTMGLGSGYCRACDLKKDEEKANSFEVLNLCREGFIFRGSEYSLHDYVYVSPFEFEERIEHDTHKAGRNVGLKAYVVCQIVEINSSKVKLRRFFRPEDISNQKAYCSDIREVYYSEVTYLVSIESIKGKCEVREKNDIPTCSAIGIYQHVFFCESLYDPSTGSLGKLPGGINVRYSSGYTGDAAARKGKEKCDEKRLATLDIFAGCGGLSEGLQQSGISLTKWAIEYEEPAAAAFKANHPEALVFINNCNVILRAMMERGGDSDDCISTPEAVELAKIMDKTEKDSLPVPGEVDFINGGPPCQGFSGMNRFNQSAWSKVQCEMILAFLSFADYFRPRYFLLENVRNFVSFNKGEAFRLTLASLLEIGYQVRFGVLEAGAYGVSQSRRRAFIWAASPEDILPEWPEPMHVFSAPELKVKFSKTVGYAAARSTAKGAAFRSMTVRDTIGDLPAVRNGASKTNMEYQSDPVSWFQQQIRGGMSVLNDHITKEMNELNLIRCKKIPKRPGADWRDLPDIKVTLSSGEARDLIPSCLLNSADRHNQWKGLFGRLDWEGSFPTSVTDPQPTGKVGMCCHPEQDRIITVRECARSQGFSDSYKFVGTLAQKHRQIGNAVPPPLAFALGRKLKEAVDSKSLT